MFFSRFDPMTTEAVHQKVNAKPKADGSFCACLAGLSFRAALEGNYAPDELRYHILDAEQLTVTENGQSFTVPYSAASLGPVILLTHLLPGEGRGWHLVIDTRSWAITAFETWFGIEVAVGADLTGKRKPTHTRQIPREIQRQYYFGWADKGDNQRPEQLHTTTNRIEGRGLHWALSSGQEQLTFFPSLVCCTLVELGPEMGGITMTHPADYIRIDDEFYIFAHWEAEFSGKMWLELMNFFEPQAIGLEFGFDEANEVVYRLHSASITITGDAAHLEPIHNFGDQGAPMAHLRGKGARYAYRPMDIDIPMTREETLAKAREKQSIFDFSEPSTMFSTNNLPFSTFLVGKQFKVKLDNEQHTAAPWGGRQPGQIFEYDFVSADRLRYRTEGHDWTEEQYVCFEPARHIYFFNHLVTGDPDYTNISQAIDFSTGLTTTIIAQVGNWHSEWEVGSRAKFGTLDYGDIKAPFARRHHYTNDFVGKCFAWAYSPRTSSIHIYSSPESYSWTIFQGDNSGGATWSSPCYTIKLRDDAYLFQWVEENCNGMQTVVIMNRNIQHDGGFSFGVNHDGLMMSITGAYMRELGSFDIQKYFDK